MKLAIPATLLSFAGLVLSASVMPRQQICPEAIKFGSLHVGNPTGNTSFNAGDEIVIDVDFNCAIHSFNIIPRFLDYSIVVPASANNGHEPPIVLARRTLEPGAQFDSFRAQIPHGFYFLNAPYEVSFTNTYPINGTDKSEVLVQGSVSLGITINP